MTARAFSFASITAAYLAAVTLIASLATPAAAAPKIDWDQVKNIKEVAVRIAKIQRSRGASKAFEYIIACYKTHGASSKYSRYFEGCIAQDYIHTQALAAVYSRIPTEDLKKMGAPSPKLLAQAMGNRVASAFAKYDVSPAKANAFKELVDKHGFDLFGNIVFPKGKPKTQSNKKTRE